MYIHEQSTRNYNNNKIIKTLHVNTLAFQKVTNMTFKWTVNFRALKSVNPKSSGGSAPWTPGRGKCPCTPPGALRRAPGPHPKSARAYAKSLWCAPRIMFAQKGKRWLYPARSKKIGSRFALAMCATRTCLPPIINRCPLLAPPLFKSWCHPLTILRAD